MKNSTQSLAGTGENGTANQLPSKEVRTDVPFERRRLNLGAVPDNGDFLTVMDMDLTVACNLRCTYCFKEKWNEKMEDSVAFDAIVWFLYASGPVKDLSVNFLGGEPLIRFPLIQRIVPFARRRAWQMGKNIHFSATTNGTLVTDKVVEFWRKWGMGFHTSIDGTPEVQDVNRPMASGRGSSSMVEKGAKKILSYRPETAARATVTPESVGKLVESYHYFRGLGYTNIAFVPGAQSLWTNESNTLYEEQFTQLGEILIGEYRNGNDINLTGIDYAIQGVNHKIRSDFACGAGRGMLLVDIHGDIWPCHRWNKGKESYWQIGSIYNQFNQMVRAELECSCRIGRLEEDCEHCIANTFCSGGCPAENLEETGKVYKRQANACAHMRVWAGVGPGVAEERF